MIGTIDRVSARIPSIRFPIPSIQSRPLIFLVSFALVVELYHLPEPLDVLAKAGFRGMGLGSLTFLIAAFYFLRTIVAQPQSLFFPGMTTLILFYCGVLLSFLVNGMESSFDMLLQSESYLKTTTLIRGAGFLVIFIAFFRNYESLALFFKIVLFLSALVLLSFLLGIDKTLLSYLGKSPDMGASEEIFGLLLDRPTFGTMNGNTFAGIVVGIMLIALCCILTETKKSLAFLYAICGGMCLLAVIKGASRGASIMAGAGLAALLFTSMKGVGFKDKSVHLRSAFILGLGGIGFGYLLNKGALFVLSARWTQIATNISLKSFDFIQTYSAYDNFTVRVLTAIDALPNGLMEWIWGNGGIQKSYSTLFGTSCHSDLANLLGQYGLIGFVPYIGYILCLFFYLLRRQLLFADVRIRTLRSLGLALIVAFLLESLFSPLFFSRWLWLGIITAIAMIIQNAENRQASSNSGDSLRRIGKMAEI